MSGAAVARHAKPSADFAGKLGRTCGHGHADGSGAAITQASSLGAEDTVISHLIKALGLTIDIFVLDTGVLHPETRALLQRLQRHSRLPVRVFQPAPPAAIRFVACEGADAMYRSIELRKTCPAARSARPSRSRVRWPAKTAGSPACDASNRPSAPWCH